jgi:transposase
MTTLYAGIDLHSNNNVVVVMDEADTVVYRQRLRNELDAALGALAPFQSALRGVVVESTYNWYWLVDGLMDHGYRVHLANTGAIQKYSGLKYADDVTDARWLAKLLRLGILPEGYIYPKEERPTRDLLRKRAHLVRHQTSHVTSVENLFARNTGGRLSAAGVKRLTDEEAQAMLAHPELSLAVECSLAVLRCLLAQIAKLEKAALAQARLRDEFRVLLTVPGIGRVLALTIMLETGAIGRFPTVGDFASYARCVDSGYVSNGKKKGKGNTKNGNAYLAWAFSEAATYAVRYEEVIERYYQRKLGRSKHFMVARKAVAHKLARACYHMLREQTRFDVKRAFS